MSPTSMPNEAVIAGKAMFTIVSSDTSAPAVATTATDAHPRRSTALRSTPRSDHLVERQVMVERTRRWPRRRTPRPSSCRRWCLRSSFARAAVAPDLVHLVTPGEGEADALAAVGQDVALEPVDVRVLDDAPQRPRQPDVEHL